MQLKKYSILLSLIIGLKPITAEAWDAVTEALYNAAASGRYDTINYYLSRGYSIDSLDDRGMTALCRAQYSGNQRAYNVLLSYGANPNASCMYAASSSAPAHTGSYFTTSWTPYLIGAAVIGSGVAIAAAASGGGGGGKSSSSNNNDNSGNNGNDSGNNNDYNSGNNDDSNSGYIDGGNTGDNSSGNNKPSANYTPYSIADFRKNKEYTGGWFDGTLSDGRPAISVNYHEPVHAAQAYGEFYGYDNAGNVVSKLPGNVLVGVLDTGVNRQHREFKDTNGNSIVTKWHNYDYGPCTAANTQNCWRVVQSGTYFTMNLIINGVASDEQIRLTKKSYNDWIKTYKSDYVYNENDDTPGSSSHGSNVAGIIAANWDPNGYGAMGIAFTNTQIDAIRWDMKSSFVRPIQAFLTDNAYLVNMSLGTPASSSENAGLSRSSLRQKLEADTDILSAAKLTMNAYTKNSYDGTTDGMIWLFAAGNEAYNQPSIESGLKLLDGYKDMLMLTVVSVQVNDDGTYHLSDFSNHCGAAKGYCIAAPGGDGKNNPSAGYVVYNADNSTTYSGFMGTSQATPVVSGSIAFIKEAYPWMKASQIIELIRETASTKGDGYNSNNHTDSKYGAGLIDLGAAVMTYVSDTSAPNSLSTVSGDNVYSSQVALNSAHLNVSSVFANALKNALPQTITAFDKYKRPFAINTANYITETHAGFKNLKSDVMNIATPHDVVHQEKNGISFAYTKSAKGGLSWMNTRYNSGKHTTGFYFSQDTHYGTTKRTAREMSNPFMAMRSAYGLSHDYRLNSFANITFEAVGGENALYDGDFEFGDSSFHKSAYAINSELTLKKNNMFSFGISSGLLYEDGALLGMNGNGALDVSNGKTYTTGAKLSLFITDKLSVSGSYYRGYSEAGHFNSNLLKTTRLESDSFSFDTNYRYTNDIDFGLRLSSPLRIEKGNMIVNFPSGRDSFSDTVYREQYTAHLRPVKREYKLAIYANNKVSEKLSWRSELATRIHPEHKDTKNDYRALFGLSYAFN